MKRLVPSAMLALLSLALFSGPSSAQEGPLRQRLKERWMLAHPQTSAHAMDSSARERITRPGDYTFTLRHDGLTRMYRIHVPGSYDAASPAPLVVALHGGGGNMDYQADDARYGLITKSEQAGFVVVFPNGFSKLGSGKFATWNAGNCCGGARDGNADDVGFIRQVVAMVNGQLNIDRRRIFAAGMSNGGMMAYRLACELPDVFSAIAAVAGTDNTAGCQPKRPISILHIHARDDTHVLFDGGAGPGVPNRDAVTDFASVKDTVAKRARIDGCTAPPRRILETPGAYCEAYSRCRGDTRVELCVTETGGHSWPGAVKTRGEPASQAISANDVMWEFFSRH